jgi:tRNA threonylcarbamoyladenosine biosynthesis protein TsaB
VSRDILLAIETSGRWSSVALLSGGRTLAETGVAIGKDHSGPLAGRIAALLAATGIDVGEVDAVAVSRGPGSFTGLRVGVGFAKGFITGTTRKLYAVSALETVAAGVLFSELPICAMLDAKKGEVYAALYRAEKGRIVLREGPLARTPGELLEEIAEPVLFVGDGALAYRRLIEERFGKDARVAPPSFSLPRAGVMGELVCASPSGYLVTDPGTFEPHYMRPPEAVVKWTETERA